MNHYLRKMGKMAAVLAVVGISACSTTSGGPGEDPYAKFRKADPKSILVLPAANESVDIEASYSWLSTASEPIAEQGFYVFPVAIVDEFMKENGLPNPEDMHQAPLNKIDEIFGADAVLYVTIEEYGQKFQLVRSVTKITARAELVDVKTGESLWADTVVHSEASQNNSGGGLLGSIISAAVSQVGESIKDTAHDASRLANQSLFRRPGSGLLLGPLHPGYAEQAVAAAAKYGSAPAPTDVPAE